MTRVLSIVVATIFCVAGVVGEVHCQDKGAAAKTPRRGGVLREIVAAGPRVLGYTPEMGPGDSAAVMPATERLMEYNDDKELVPFLAESVTIAKDLKSMTFKLRKGIKFHDGTEMNAEAVAWNYQLSKDSKRIQFEDRRTKIEVVDNYTVRLHISNYSNQLLYWWGWQFRPFEAGVGEGRGRQHRKEQGMGQGKCRRNRAFQACGIQARQLHEVGQERELLAEGQALPRRHPRALCSRRGDGFRHHAGKRSRHVVRRTRQGRGKSRETRLPEPEIRHAEDDFFQHEGSGVDNSRTRKCARRWNMGWISRPWRRPSGLATTRRSTQVAPPGQWGYDPQLKGRAYNPVKAKQLLKEAGYPNGIKVKLLSMTAPPYPDEAQAIKRYLDEVGIMVDPDLADTGRFFSRLLAEGVAGHGPFHFSALGE